MDLAKELRNIFERATRGTMRASELAQEEARRLLHSYVGTEHLLVGLVAEGDGIAARVLRVHGVDLERARHELDRLVDQGVLPGPRLNDAELLGTVGVDLDEVRRRNEETFGLARWTRRRGALRGAGADGIRLGLRCAVFPSGPGVKRAMELAAQEADALASGLVDTEHVLLGLLGDAIEPFGDRVNRRSRRILAPRGLPPDTPIDAGVVLRGFGIDLDNSATPCWPRLERLAAATRLAVRVVEDSPRHRGTAVVRRE